MKKQKAILCDIDGTLALRGVRNPYNFKRVGEDDVNAPIAELLRLIAKAKSPYKIILLSGRDEVCRKQTESWLLHNKIPYDELFMRAAKDNRSDTLIKRELYDQHIKDKYEILFVLDDRQQVVNMWRNDLGLTCLQVAEGDF